MPSSLNDLTLNQRSGNWNRKRFHRELREKAGSGTLRTIPADPGNENIPQSIAGMFGEDRSAMLTVPQSRYVCMTQGPVTPVPTSDPLALWVGSGGTIPRWAKNQTVQFAALATGYPTRNHASYAAYKLNEAAIEWNSHDVGVKFKWVTDLDDAAFVLSYGGDQGNVLAMAFFPDDKVLNTLFVYQGAFDTLNNQYMANTFLHELGHVLGLRHEFADQEGGAVRFGPPNPHSVMGYELPPKIQDSDLETIKKFYNFTATSFGGLRIVEWIPDN